MKLGLLADVRGMVDPLKDALAILAEEDCGCIACLGSTVEGGEEDEQVLEALRSVEALIVPSPHDAAGRLEGRPPQVEACGLMLAHETLGGSDDVLWLTGFPAP